jgi:hypothetical protein
MTAPTRRVADRGVQQERTGLAWNRTAASMMVAGALHLRLGAIAGGGLAFLPGSLFLALGLLFMARSSRRYLGIRAERPVGSAPAYLVVGATVLFGMVSMGLVVGGA